MKYAVMTTWQHKNPIDWDELKAAMCQSPEGTTVQWFEIDEYSRGSFVTYPSKEDFEVFITEQTEEQTEYRIKRFVSMEMEMTMEAIGPIHVEVGID